MCIVTKLALIESKTKKVLMRPQVDTFVLLYLFLFINEFHLIKWKGEKNLSFLFFLFKIVLIALSLELCFGVHR